jgi:hypothetical protein
MEYRWEAWNVVVNGLGMSAWEKIVAARAIEHERKAWLRILEDTLARLGDQADTSTYIRRELEIRRLRRLLGLPRPPTPAQLERRREKTRERVRRYRQRRPSRKPVQ